MTNRVTFFKAEQSPRLQAWSNWVTSGGETAAILTPELTTLNYECPKYTTGLVRFRS